MGLNGQLSNPQVLNGTLSNEILRGYSAYQIAVMLGFEGTEAEWIESLRGGGQVESGGYYTLDIINKNEDTIIISFIPSEPNMDAIPPKEISLPRGKDGKDGSNGSDGVGILSIEQTTTSTEDNGENVVTVTLTNGQKSTFTVRNGSKGNPGTGGGGDIDLSDYATKEELKTKANAIITEKSGSAIVSTDSSEEAPEGLSVYGKSTQETTPGNQLLPNCRHETVTESGITYTNNGDGTYTLNGTSTKYVQFIDTNSFVLVAGTYNVSGGDVYTQVRSADGGTGLKSGNGSFTLEEETEVKFRQTVSQNVTYANKHFSPMINKGTTSLPWEPYTNGASPNPEYPQEIESCENTEVGVYGDNLLEITATSQTVNGITFTVNEEDKSITANGTATEGAYLALNTNFIFKRGQSYILNGCPAGGSKTKYMQYIDGKSSQDYGSGVTYTPTEDTTAKVMMVIRSGVTVNNLVFKPMIRLASIKDATYKPYTKQSLTIPRTLCGIPVTNANLATYTDENGQMWCADEVDFERGVYVQRFLKSKLTKENFIWSPIQYTGIKENHINFRVEIEGTKENGYVFSNILPMKNNIWGYDVLGCQLIEGNNIDFTMPYESLGITKDATEDERTSAMKTYLESHEIYFYAELNTPIETPLSEEELNQYKALKMNYPNTTILNDANAHMEVKYIADTQNHIEQNYVPVSEFNALVTRVKALEQNAV